MPDLYGYWKAMLKYHGMWEKRFKNEKAAMAQAIAHLEYIRQREAKLSQINAIKELFKNLR